MTDASQLCPSRLPLVLLTVGLQSGRSVSQSWSCCFSGACELSLPLVQQHPLPSAQNAEGALSSLQGQQGHCSASDLSCPGACLHHLAMAIRTQLPSLTWVLTSLSCGRGQGSAAGSPQNAAEHIGKAGGASVRTYLRKGRKCQREEGTRVRNSRRLEEEMLQYSLQPVEDYGAGGSFQKDLRHLSWSHSPSSLLSHSSPVPLTQPISAAGE